MKVPTKTCFVISPIGEQGSETRRKADDVFQYLICSVVNDMGYDAVRADHIDVSGTITTQIIQNLISADLVIADLSERNPNVFYELSVRHASRKPFIQLITYGEPIPFDVAANRTIQYDLTRIGVVEAAKSQMRAQIESIESGSDDIENPISMSIDLGSLRASPSSTDRTLGEMLSTITEIGARVAKIDQTLSPNERARIEYSKSERDRLNGQFMAARAEIHRLRAIKGQINFDAVDEPYKVGPILDALSEIIDQIVSQSAPKWDERFKEPLATELFDLATKIKSISEDIIPF